MTLTEVGLIVGRHIQVCPTIEPGFYATLEGCEIQQSSAVLASPVGFGATRAEARKALALRLTGKRLLFHAHSRKRREFNLSGIKVTSR
jgi:hypothetical protein